MAIFIRSTSCPAVVELSLMRRNREGFIGIGIAASLAGALLEVHMRLTLALTFVLLIAPSPMHSDTVSPHNGVWWTNLDAAAKRWFVAGYMEGIDHADFLLGQALKFDKMKVTDSSDPVSPYIRFYNVMYSQFQEGLDTFYADYRNKRINFNPAILYVRDQIQGVSPKGSRRAVRPHASCDDTAGLR